MEKRNHIPQSLRVVLEVLREEQTVNEIAAKKYEMSPVMICNESKQEHLEKLVGQLTVEVDWLKKKSSLKRST
jgi:putative transposase